MVLDLGEMPMHVWRDEEGDEQVTLAEAWLERKGTERLVKLGLMPFLSVRGQNALQLFRFVSLAQPPKGQPATDLVGRWGQKGSLKVPRSVGLRGGGGVGLVGGAPPPSPAAEEPPTATEESSDEAPPAEEETASPAAEEAPASEPPAEAAAEDPELAALLAQLESGAAETPPGETPPEEVPAAEAAEEMDPELAALLQQLEQPAEAPAAETPAEAEAPPAEACRRGRGGNGSRIGRLASATGTTRGCTCRRSSSRS